MSLKLQVIITAAGMSKRHPPNKLLLDVKGKSVINRTINTFDSIGIKSIIVTGYQADKITNAIKSCDSEKITVVFNAEFQSGLSSSMQVGIKSCNEDIDYFIFCNGDKPFINAKTVKLLISQLKERKPKILIPQYNGKTGHPTFFHRSLKQELLKINGDEGGRSLITKYNDNVLFVDVEDEGVIMDMDRYLSNEN